jgi:hypothetical protein
MRGGARRRLEQRLPLGRGIGKAKRRRSAGRFAARDGRDAGVALVLRFLKARRLQAWPSASKAAFTIS